MIILSIILARVYSQREWYKYGLYLLHLVFENALHFQNSLQTSYVNSPLDSSISFLMLTIFSLVACILYFKGGHLSVEELE